MNVKFGNVSGRLVSYSRPEGFALVDAHGSVVPWLYKTELHGDRVVLKAYMPAEEAAGLKLHYGFGLNPYCNITDEGDRCLPAFGPVTIGQCKGDA
jgi:sialate O-acetylesterase